MLPSALDRDGLSSARVHGQLRPVEEPSTVSNTDAPCVIPFHRWASRLFRGWSRDLKIGAKALQPKSNNSRKPRALFDAGIKVAAQILCEAAPNSHALAYLRNKKKKWGHTLSLGQYECMWWANHRHADDKDFGIR